MSTSRGSDRAVSRGLAASPARPRSEMAALLARSAAEQRRRGYADTLREILQQPDVWTATAAAVAKRTVEIQRFLRAARLGAGKGTLLLTGSGSSLYVGECLTPGLGAALGVPARAVAAGDLLTHEDRCLPHAGPVVLLSVARSGNSPESVAAVERLLAHRRVRHIVLTCNAGGGLATTHARDPRLLRIVLDPRTNDRSLVMTSSFTSMLVAGRALAHLADPGAYRRKVAVLAEVGRRLLGRYPDALARIAGRGFSRAVHLGTGPHFGAAREASLKLLEMTAGQIPSFPETFLGLRHGPMSAVGDRTLVVAFLASDPLMRAYEIDLLRELRRKQPRAVFVITGERVPADLCARHGLAVELPLRDRIGDDDAVVLDVVVGQLVGFFTSLALGHKPDAPSPDGVITRVVGAFTLHGA